MPTLPAVLVAMFALTTVSGSVAYDGRRDIGKRDVDFLRGTWTLVAIEFHDKDVVERLAPGQFSGEMTIAENTYTLDVTIRGQQQSRKLSFILHPKRTPKAFEAIDDTPTVYKGIYELKGDTLQRCYANPGEPRPTRFRAPGQTYQVWRWKGH